MTLVMFEIFLGYFEKKLSKDVLHEQEIGQIFKSKNTIIFLGNSLTREGINQSLFNKSMIDIYGEDFNIGYVYPDDTSIIEWYYIIKSYMDNDLLPKYLFINFAANQLLSPDIKFEEIQRIAGFINFTQITSVIIDEDLNIGQSMDLILCKVSKLYKHRERIQRRILDNIPNYRLTTRKYNEILKKHYPENVVHEYKYLKNILTLFSLNDSKVIFCSLPIESYYSLDKTCFTLIENSKNSILLDLQNIDLYDDSHFSDGLHLNSTGSKILTETLIKYIIDKNIK